MTHTAALRSHDRSAHLSIRDQLDGRYVAPRRFDAYEVTTFLERIGAETGHLVVDCSRVQFLDLSAHRVLSDASRRGVVTVLDPSSAVLLTRAVVAATAPSSSSNAA
jgi:hypothetical protein